MTDDTQEKTDITLEVRSVRLGVGGRIYVAPKNEPVTELDDEEQDDGQERT